MAHAGITAWTVAVYVRRIRERRRLRCRHFAPGRARKAGKEIAAEHRRASIPVDALAMFHAPGCGGFGFARGFVRLAFCFASGLTGFGRCLVAPTSSALSPSLRAPSFVSFHASLAPASTLSPARSIACPASRPASRVSRAASRPACGSRGCFVRFLPGAILFALCTSGEQECSRHHQSEFFHVYSSL